MSSPRTCPQCYNALHVLSLKGSTTFQYGQGKNESESLMHGAVTNIPNLNHCIPSQAPKVSCWPYHAKRIKSFPKHIKSLNCSNIAQNKRIDQKNKVNKQTKNKSKLSSDTQGKLLVMSTQKLKRKLRTSKTHPSKPTPKAKKIESNESKIKT